ncbi:MAG: cytochrome b [Sphingomicrobium sp.]
MNDQTSFDTATRVAAGDDGTTYDRVAIALHWITALLVLVQFVNGITWDYWARPTRQELESIHVSLGVLLAAVIVVRLVWRWLPGHQVSSLEAGWVRSKAVHYLLYALLVAQAATGFAWRWAPAPPAGFFGLFGIPGPYGEQPRPVRMQLHELHEWTAYAIAALALGHALAALYHHYVLKDRVLVRMLPRGARSG